MVRDPCLQECLRSKFFATALSWGTKLDPYGRIIQEHSNVNSGSSNADCGNGDVLTFDCDVVIASDVVYDPAGYEPLVQTLCGLLKGYYTEFKPYSGSSGAALLQSNTAHSKEYPVTSLLRTVMDQHSSGKKGLMQYVHTGPICILAHRHRHPENER